MAKDKGFSWVIAFACCFINCLMYGVTRLSGLLLVSTVETFHVTRASAAIPFSVSTSVRNLSGIFVGYLGQKFGLRIVISIGCLLASLGAGFCFFASDVLWITVFWGGLFGIGSGFATCLLPLAINDHFEKHRGTALGISYSGSYVGSFIFPPIVVQLVDKYGLRGAFLVISASLLNGLIASLLFRAKPPKAQEKNDFQNSNVEEKKIPYMDSDIPSGRDFKNYYRIIWHKLVYQVKKMSCLLQSIEFTYGQPQPQINLTSAAALRTEEEHSCEIPSEIFPVVSKSIEENHENLELVVSYVKNAENQMLSYRPDDVYFHCRSASFKIKSKAEYKNKIVHLKNLDLVRFFKKRHSFNVYSIQLPRENVRLVSIRNEDGSYYSNLSSNVHYDKTPLHKLDREFTSDNISNDHLLYEKNTNFSSVPNETPNILHCSAMFEKENSNFESHLNFLKLYKEFASNQTECNYPHSYEINSITPSLTNLKAHTKSECCVEQESNNSSTNPYLYSSILIGTPTLLQGTNERSEMHEKDSSANETGNTSLNHLCSQTSDVLNCSENSSILHSNTKYLLDFEVLQDSSRSSAFQHQTGTNKHNSSIEDTCSRRIFRQDYSVMSHLPSANTPTSNKLEDSKCRAENSSNKKKLQVNCPSSENVHPTNKLGYSECNFKKCLKMPQIRSPLVKNTAKCCFGWFRMYADPMFVVITTTMSLHTFVVVCMITIIEDFAKDLHVPENQVHCVLMALSIADLLSALTLGVVTDRQLMSGCHFVVLCFSGTGACILAISYSHNLSTLLTLVSIYGIFETGVVITLPLLIAQFIEVKKQAIALAASNILSSPTVLLVPLVIGYFRDHIGCYSGVFYVLSITSFISSFIWLLAPYLINKYRSKRKISSQC